MIQPDEPGWAISRANSPGETEMFEDRRQIIEYNNKPVIVHNYSGLEGTEFVKVIQHVAVLVQNDQRTDKLILIDISDTIVDQAVMAAFRNMTEGQSKTVKRSAIVGLTGIQTLFVQVITRFTQIDIKPFDSREEALEWLTAQ